MAGAVSRLQFEPWVAIKPPLDDYPGNTEHANWITHRIASVMQKLVDSANKNARKKNSRGRRPGSAATFKTREEALAGYRKAWLDATEANDGDEPTRRLVAEKVGFSPQWDRKQRQKWGIPWPVV